MQAGTDRGAEGGRDKDIRGAFGTIQEHDVGARVGSRARLLTLLAIIGPGLIVTVGDNDAGGLSTYAQAGQDFGLTLLWTLMLCIPVLIVNQEMVARLGAVSGVGHARLVRERFGRLWGAIAVSSILIVNFLIIITEFIGVSQSLTYFGVRPQFSVPLAGLGLLAIIATGSYRRWERIMFIFIVVSLLAIPLIVFSHPAGGGVVHGLFVPGAAGGFAPPAVLLTISIVGTTVAPWQLYFQQSNIVDKRITTRWLNYERADTVIGAIIVIVTAVLIVAAVSAGVAGTSAFGRYTDALGVAQALQHHVGAAAGAMFAILLFNASIIGAATVTLASSYALGDVSGLRQSLNSKVRDAKGFYGFVAVLIAVAGATVLVSDLRAQGIITLAVQAACGILLPATTVFALLLCNDREVLGPWTNGRWQNMFSLAIVLSLFVLSATLMATTVLPSTPVLPLLEILSGAAVVGFAVAAPRLFRASRRAPTFDGDRFDWRTPRLNLLATRSQSSGRRILFGLLGAYLAVSSILLVVRVVRLAIG
ncbi:MAG TPA: NRAMP family divalent metal transporter [Acidimicrobiales bacterium]|jgi:NRAMP (natural resistance-associated macrophage protein)-like metal ion transporter|nr:NRAMP family divalent metal transporter [Acidimicrobiales bacterium]